MGREMPEWLTVAEATAYLKVTRRTLYRWCEQGRLRYYELESGGGRRFKREDLDKLLRPSRREAMVEELGRLVHEAAHGRADPESLRRMRELADEFRHWPGLETFDTGTAGLVRRADDVLRGS